MFVLTHKYGKGKGESKAEYFDDIKSLGQAVFNITDSEYEANSAMKWCGTAQWGSKVTRLPKYKIECFNEEQLKADVEKVVKEICDKANIGYSFIGFDNDALTWDIDLDLSWIKFHHDFGYYIVINKYDEINGVTELFSLTTRDKKKFIAGSVAGIEKLTKGQLGVKEEAKPKAVDSRWHKHYHSGGNTKKGANDHIEYYYRADRARIVVGYSDWRHNKAVLYSAYDAYGRNIGSFTKLSEAQKALN